MQDTLTLTPINKKQILIGFIALLIGSLVYLIDRSPGQTYFIFKAPFSISLYHSIPNLFGIIGDSLPAFLHVFSFILLTGSLIFCSKRGYLIICLFWFLVDAAFELGQKFNGVTSHIIPDWFEGIPFLENTKAYFLHGTFDVVDLAALAVGSLAAYIVISATGKRRLLP
jgi:hypothetical protein